LFKGFSGGSAAGGIPVPLTVVFDYRVFDFLTVHAFPMGRPTGKRSREKLICQFVSIPAKAFPEIKSPHHIHPTGSD
jgi:hypothetical protein